MTKRRKFLKNSSYLMAGAFILPMGCTKNQQQSETATESSAPSVNTTETNEIGVQVYSVRDALKEDFAGSLKKLAEIGYKYVEAYGLGLDGQMYGMAPGEYKKITNDLGLELISSHSTYFTPDNASAIVDAAQESGVKYVIIPYLDDDLRADYYKVADNLNNVGELFQGTGIRLGYHNHAFEFEAQNGEIPLEIMISNTQPELVTFQADLYWVTRAGANQMDLINKFPGRFSSYHIKDADSDLEQTTVGTGIIDFATIMGANEKAGIKHYFVEDEREDDPFGNLKANFDYLNAADFI